MTSRDGKSQRREEKRREKKRREERISKRESLRRKKIQMREKVRKSRNTVFSNDLCAEPARQMTDEKLHAIVARSTFPSQHVQNTPGSEHFGKL